MEEGCLAYHLESWVQAERPDFNPVNYGFQEFAEALNYAQDKLLVRVVPDEEKGLLVYLGAEFYPPAVPEEPAPPEEAAEVDEPQPIVKGQPSAVPEPEPKPRRRTPRKTATAAPRKPDTRRRRRSPKPQTAIPAE